MGMIRNFKERRQKLMRFTRLGSSRFLLVVRGELLGADVFQVFLFDHSIYNFYITVYGYIFVNTSLDIELCLSFL